MQMQYYFFRRVNHFLDHFQESSHFEKHCPCTSSTNEKIKDNKTADIRFIILKARET